MYLTKGKRDLFCLNIISSSALSLITKLSTSILFSFNLISFLIFSSTQSSKYIKATSVFDFFPIENKSIVKFLSLILLLINPIFVLIDSLNPSLLPLIVFSVVGSEIERVGYSRVSIIIALS